MLFPCAVEAVTSTENNKAFTYFLFGPLLPKTPFSQMEHSFIRNSLTSSIKDFQLISSKGTIFQVNKTIIFFSSNTIKKSILNDPDNQSFTINFSSESIIEKFASILNGNPQKFTAEEIDMIPNFCKELNIQGFPSWLTSVSSKKQIREYKFQNLSSLPFSITIQSFQSFMTTPRLQNFPVTIKNKHCTYEVPLFGALGSTAFSEFYKNHSNHDNFVFNYDNDNLNYPVFEQIIGFMQKKLQSIQCNNLDLLLKYSQDLKIQSIIDFIKETFQKSEEIKQKARNNLYLLKPTNELVSMFLSMKPPTSNSSETVFKYIISSKWISDIDHLRTLIYVIQYISTYNYKIHNQILDIIVLLDKEKAKYEVLSHFIDHLLSIFLGYHADTKNPISFSCYPIIFGLLNRNLVSPYNIIDLLGFSDFASCFYRLNLPHYSNEVANRENTVDQYFTLNSLTEQQQLFFPEIKQVFPKCFLFDYNLDESMRSIEGSEGSLKRIIYDDNVEMLKEYIENHHEFSFNQTVIIPASTALSKVSILEFSAIVESPNAFKFIFSNSRITKVEISDDDIVDFPELLTQSVAVAAFGNSAIMEIISPHLNHLIMNENYKTLNRKFINQTYLYWPIIKRDLSTYKITRDCLFNCITLNNNKFEKSNTFFLNQDCDHLFLAASVYNFEIIEYLLEQSNLIVLKEPQNAFQSFFQIRNSDYFTFLLNTFDNSFLLNPQTRSERNALLMPDNKQLYRKIFDVFQQHNMEFPFLQFMDLVPPIIKFDHIKFLIEELNYKIKQSNLPPLAYPLVNSHPEIAKLIYNNCDISDESIIDFIEVTAADTDKEFIEMLIQKQLQFNSKSSFERAFNYSIAACNLEMATLIEQINVDTPIRNINEVDFSLTLTTLVRKTLGVDNMSKFIELLRIYLKYFTGIDLEKVLNIILDESIVLSNTEIALFALSYQKVNNPSQLVMASYFNLPEVVKKMIEICPDPNFYNYSYSIFGTPINSACKKGNESIVDILLTLPNLNLSTNPNPLSSAAFSRNYSIFLKILKRKVCKETDLNLALLEYIQASHNWVAITAISMTPKSSPLPLLTKSQMTHTQINDKSTISHDDIYRNPKLEDKEEFLSFFFNKNDKYNCEVDFDKTELTKYRNMIYYQFYHHSKTFLIAAANLGRSEVVRLLLLNPETNVNQYDNDGNTALIHAIFNDHFDIVQLLCEMRPDDIDINQSNFSYQTPLTYAASLNRYRILDYLLKHPGIDYQKSNIVRALEEAIVARNLNIIDFLLANYITKFAFQPNCDTTSLSASTGLMTSLLYACYKSLDLATSRLIVTSPIFDHNLIQHSVQTLLFTKFFDLSFSTELMKLSGIDINCIDNISLLYRAMINGNIKLMKYILNSPDFDPIKSQYYRCFLYSYYRQKSSVWQQIIDYNYMDYNALPPYKYLEMESLSTSNRITPLSMSVNNPEVFHIILQSPTVDVNVRNENGSTALFTASQSMATLIDLLRHKDLDLNAQDNSGQTFLMALLASGNPYTKYYLPLDLIYRKDLDLSIRNNEGLNIIQLLDPSFQGDPKSLSPDDVLSYFSKKRKINFI